ncbi:fungal-specific transcription factor domain-containing protein [Rhexocercosporidium sp. MPI-PUGE-AT-0058]|nr:fungal-specific transcription factor domain-containing protein [Rhexocercosporidium sp. MPI-PUGE-AT-0058]
MRRYHTEKRNQGIATTGDQNKVVQRPPQPTQNQPMIIEWATPISSIQSSGTSSQAPLNTPGSRTAPRFSIGTNRTVEHSLHCLCSSANGKQSLQSSECICVQAQPHAGLQPAFQGEFPVKNRSLQFLQFSIHEVARLNIPMGMQAEISWFTQATVNPAFFHGTLLLGATHRALTLDQASPFPPECYYHQAEAIRHIIANLENPEAQLHEGNIAAVACLAAFETAISGAANEPVHIDGLERLITVRKARKQEGLAGYLQNLIQWVDVSHASANLTRPRFLSIQANCPIPPKATLDDEIRLLDVLNSQYPSTFPSSPVTIYEGMDGITAYIFHRVRQLSSLASQIKAYNPRAEATEDLRQQYTQGMLLLEGQVNASIWSLIRNNVRQYGSATQPRADDTVRSCTRTWHGTCLLYIHLFLRRAQPGPRNVVISKVATRVKYSLRILSETELWVSFPKPFLLWVLCVVGVAESGIGQVTATVGITADRIWLLQMLGKLRGIMGLQSWEEARGIVTQFAWVEHLCDAPSRTLWEDSDRFLMELSGMSEIASGEKWSAPLDASSLYGPNPPNHVIDAEQAVISKPSKEFTYLDREDPGVLLSV